MNKAICISNGLRILPGRQGFKNALNTFRFAAHVFKKCLKCWTIETSTRAPLRSHGLFGYGSCTAWASYLVAALKAVGVPAREAGSPCWNTGEFAGAAVNNQNVSACWSGGLPGGPSGGT